MADYGVECYTAPWWGQAALHMVVLLGFSVGTIVASVRLLYKRRAKLQDDETQRYFGLLYLVHTRTRIHWKKHGHTHMGIHPRTHTHTRTHTQVYTPERYYYEAVNMSFKVGSSPRACARPSLPT